MVSDRRTAEGVPGGVRVGGARFSVGKRMAGWRALMPQNAECRLASDRRADLELIRQSRSVWCWGREPEHTGSVTKIALWLSIGAVGERNRASASYKIMATGIARPGRFTITGGRSYEVPLPIGMSSGEKRPNA